MKIKHADAFSLAAISYLILPLLQAGVLYQGYAWFVCKYISVDINYWYIVGAVYILVFLKSSYRLVRDGQTVDGNAALQHVIYKYFMTIIAFLAAWITHMMNE